MATYTGQNSLTISHRETIDLFREVEANKKTAQAKLYATDSLMRTITTTLEAQPNERAAAIHNFTTALIQFKSNYPRTYKPERTLAQVQASMQKIEQNDSAQSDRVNLYLNELFGMLHTDSQRIRGSIRESEITLLELNTATQEFLNEQAYEEILSGADTASTTSASSTASRSSGRSRPAQGFYCEDEDSDDDLDSIASSSRPFR